MSDIPSKTYIYLLAQFSDSGEMMFSESLKIGKADDLRQRFNQEYKGKTGYIDPRYIRILEINTDHNAPDKKLHGLLDILCNPEHTKIRRKSKHRELYEFINQESLDWFDKQCELLGYPYYKNQHEISKLLNKNITENIVSKMINNMINDVVNGFFHTQPMITITDTNLELNIKYLHNLIEKAILKNPAKASNEKGYFQRSYLTKIVSIIEDFSEFKKLIETNDSSKIKQYLTGLKNNLKQNISNGTIKKDNFSNSIINKIIYMYSV